MFLFVVDLDCVENGLGVGCDLVCGRVPDGGKVRSDLGSRLEAGRDF